jgi:alkanesulfonate monooxygenase SsuD/methylene tetrahydromethanopterin reductase-like flavin-dependent oxidoreductase (luciferase family)
MLLPIREPILLAKQIGNLDAFSRGRAIIGIGIGNATDREEFKVMGMKLSYSERWNLAKEYVEAMNEIWTKPNASYHGKYANFDNATIYPKPYKKPRPPLLVGGHSDNALRFGATMTDGLWGALNTPEVTLETKTRFLEFAKTAGKGSHNFIFGTMCRVSIAATREEAISNIGFVTSGHKARTHLGHARMLFHSDQEAIKELNTAAAIGAPSDVAKRIEEFVEAGVTFFDLYFMYPDIGHHVKQMKLFAREVLPSYS